MGKIYMFDSQGFYSGEKEIEAGCFLINSLPFPPGDGTSEGLAGLPAGYSWKAMNNQWVPAVVPEPVNIPYENLAVQNQIEELKNQLAILDDKSIRSMREWITSKEDPPQWLLDYNAQATELRNQLAELLAAL